MHDPHLIQARIRALESPEYRGTAARRRAQRHQQKTAGFQGARISIDSLQRIAQAAQHFVEDHDIEIVRGKIVLAVRRDEGTALDRLALRHGDRAARHVDPDVLRIARTRQPAQQNALAASRIQHRCARLQVADIAREYAEARKLGNLRKEAFNLRFQKAGGQLGKTGRVRQVRRDIARIKTVLGEKAAG